MVDQLERYGGSAGEVWWISWRGMVDQLERYGGSAGEDDI
jgi:hypothetical protein